MAEALDNLEVQYTYHVHEGVSNVIGGCYGNKSVLCGNVIFKEDAFSSECSSSVCTSYYKKIFMCSTCNQQTGWYCTNYNNCGTAQGLCGGQHYKANIDLICGKTTDTIESATIIY